MVRLGKRQKHRDNTKGFCIVATRDVNRGERIDEEAPLVSLDAGLADTFNPNSFYDSRYPRHAVEQLERLQYNFPAAKQGKLSRLAGAGEGMAAILRYNAWGYDEEQENGTTRRTLRLYDRLSRLNHSCQPNALLQWNSKLEQATLYALKPIPEGDEITVDYLGTARDSLRSVTTRRKYLQNGWNFHCECPMCLTGDQGADSVARVNAADLHRQILSTNTHPDDTADLIRLRKIGQTETYIRALRDLGLTDQRIAWAYWRLIELHEEGFNLGRRDPNHCVSCMANHSARGHLEEAMNELHNLRRFEICYCGSDQPDYNDTLKKINELEAKINSLIL